MSHRNSRPCHHLCITATEYPIQQRRLQGATRTEIRYQEAFHRAHWMALRSMRSRCAFQRAVSHSKTLEHTENISTMLITIGVESSTSCVTFCDNNLREVGLLVQRSSILEENPYLFHRQGNLTGQPAFSLHLCDDSVTVDDKQRIHGLQHAQQFDEPPTRFPSVYNVVIHL